MRNELKHIEVIEKYLLDNMNADEKAAFEIRMKEDESLQNDVSLQQQIMQRLQFDAFKNELNDFHAGLATTKNAWWKKAIYLNSFLALLVLGTAFSATYYFVVNRQYEEKMPANAKEPVKPAEMQPVVVEEEKTQEPEATEETTEPAPVKKTTAFKPFVKSISTEEKEPHYHFLMVYHTTVIDAEKGGTVQMEDSKSLIHIPANSLMYSDGTPVKGEVKIRYREYRNAAQMAFSGIPMVYYEKGQEYNFNSAGMFEVRAIQDGKELKIKPGKSFTVDYNVTEKLDSCYFFGLDDETRKWKKQQDIPFGGEAQVVAENEIKHGFVRRRWVNGEFVVDTLMVKKETPEMWSGMLKGTVYSALDGKELEGVRMNLYKSTDGGKKSEYLIVPVDSGYVMRNIEPGTYMAEIICKGYSKLKIEKVVIGKNRVTFLDARMRPRMKKEKPGVFKRMNGWFHGERWKKMTKGIKSSYELQDTCMKIEEIEPVTFVKSTHVRRNGKWVEDSVAVMPGENFLNNGGVATKKVELFGDDVKVENKGTKTKQGTMLAEGSLDPGHTYPNMVKGLNCESFGVYNCDQVYRVNDQLMVRAKYTDNNNNEIKNGHVLSMIDLKFNGAFSFSPANFTCSKSGKNILLLFTSDKKLYALSENEFKKMNIKNNGDYTFKMTDITASVKNTEDLRRYLGLKQL